MKEKKKASLRRKWLIRFSVLLAVIALFIGFIFAWNAGLGLPSGYKTASGPRNSTGTSWGEISHPLYYYLSEESYKDSYSTKYSCGDDTGWMPYYPRDTGIDRIHFEYNEEKYYSYYQGVSVFKEEDNSLAYSFIRQEKDGIYDCENKYSFIFLDDNYIYYIFTKRITRFYFELPTDSGALKNSYRKYEFYRVNLDNNQNEKININLFVEKINKYDETIKIK